MSTYEALRKTLLAEAPEVARNLDKLKDAFDSGDFAKVIHVAGNLEMQAYIDGQRSEHYRLRELWTTHVTTQDGKVIGFKALAPGVKPEDLE